MSRSYRKPYTAITGVRSAHDDKKTSTRGMRRKQNAWLHTLKDFDQAIVPHRLECTFNNIYSWGRDGRQSLTFPYSRYFDRANLAYRRWIRLQRSDATNNVHGLKIPG